MEKQSVLPPSLFDVTKDSTTNVVRPIYGGGAMVETLTIITELLYYALLAAASINIVLLVIIVYILHKQ